MWAEALVSRYQSQGSSPLRDQEALKAFGKVGCGANRFSTLCIPLVSLISVVPFLATDLAAWRTVALLGVGTTIITVGR